MLSGRYIALQLSLERDDEVCGRLCFPVPLSPGHRLFEAGVEKLFEMKARGDFGLGGISASSGQ